MLAFSDFEIAELSTLSTKSASGRLKSQILRLERLRLIFQGIESELLMIFSR
ncbi:hypothetical protein VCNHCC008D_003300 [Vibrio cholerae O1 str. NHCC-008D]|nr:hypothetical protein VCNHCC008D_003300 [Vibrio cholerae O1 str. NHCC-008D]